MKRSLFFVVITMLYLSVDAQQKEFEGTVSSSVQVRSKVEGVSDRAWRNSMAFGDSVTVTIKHGNYRQSTGPTESYFIAKDQRVYLKFRGIDTLYYREYASDTTSVQNVSKSEEKKTIAGLECKVITIKTAGATHKYYYAPSLYMNPEYDKNNSIDRYDVFAKETSSLYLGFEKESESFKVLQYCTQLQEGVVDDKVFQLPDLPRKKFDVDAILLPARFNRAGGFNKYLELNINAPVGAKYIKIPKGEETALQTAYVTFMINENGKVMKAFVANKDEVHPKVAEEALRVINASPLWTPATVLGEKIIFWYKQPITFMASRH